jgi:hypothetical protein
MAYFSNGCEGEILDQQCADCQYGEMPCPIALVQSTYNYQQIGNLRLEAAMNVLVNPKGECQMLAMMEGKTSVPDKRKLQAWNKAVENEQGA